MTSLTQRLKVGWITRPSPELPRPRAPGGGGGIPQAGEDLGQVGVVVDVGREGRGAKGADGVKGEVEAAGPEPEGRVVEGFEEVVIAGTIKRWCGLMVRWAAASGDQGGAARVRAGTERHRLPIASIRGV